MQERPGSVQHGNGPFAFLIVFCVWFLFGGTAFAQLDARLSMDKLEYRKGEPIFLRFDLINNGNLPANFAFGNSYSLCSGYDVEINKSRQGFTTCDRGSLVSCILGGATVAAKAALHDDLLLNFDHDFSNPGFYQIHASRTLQYSLKPGELPFKNDALQVKAETTLTIRVVDSVDDLSPIFTPYVADLDSREEHRRIEAARVIGSLAPAFLEDTILSMVSRPDGRFSALLGMRRLNTERSRHALADVVERTKGYSTEKELAIRYLSEMGDKKYYPLLLKEAQSWAPNQSRDYVRAAARLGGDEAMPYVVALLRDPNPFLSGNGLMSLQETGSRSAVPFLIDELRSTDGGHGRLASTGLIQLTHRSALPPDRLNNESPSSLYTAWNRWWAQEGSRAPIYGPQQCGSVELLK